MQAYFHDLVGELEKLLTGDERFLASFAGEDSDFVRFNRGEIRQAGTVSQRYLEVDLIEGRRHSSSEITQSSLPRLLPAHCTTLITPASSSRFSISLSTCTPFSAKTTRPPL